jgi:hypothetical protein
MSEGLQILLGVGLFIVLGLLGALVVWLLTTVKRLEGMFANIDRALVPFGQSGIGQLVNQAAHQGRTYVDEPGDPAVIRIATLLSSITFVAKVAEAAGVQITRERVALWGRALFDAVDQLTDGVPVQESGSDRAEAVR